METLINLTGENLLFDLVLLTVVLVLPVPTAPYLMYLVVNNGITEASILYLLASNLNCLIIFLIGFAFKYSIHFTAIGDSLKLNHKLKSLLKFIPRKFVPSENNKFKIDKLLNKASYYDIGMARTVGLHNHVVMFTFGYFNLNPFKAFVVNTVFALIDLLFYWIILGSGSMVLSYIFPNLDFRAILQSPDFTFFIIIFTVLSYILFVIYRVLLSKKRRVGQGAAGDL